METFSFQPFLAFLSYCPFFFYFKPERFVGTILVFHKSSTSSTGGGDFSPQKGQLDVNMETVKKSPYCILVQDDHRNDLALFYSEQEYLEAIKKHPHLSYKNEDVSVTVQIPFFENIPASIGYSFGEYCKTNNEDKLILNTNVTVF